MALRVKHWTAARWAEPSTHTAIGLFIAIGALLRDGQSLDGWELLPWFLAWAGFHAFLGIVLKEGKGLV